MKELLKRYTEFLEELGYTDSDWREENHDTVKAFLKQDNSIPVEKLVMRFAKPIISDGEFISWINDQNFYSTAEETPIDKYILQSYYDTVEQFINSPESGATKSVFEIATQTIKKYLEQNV